MTIEKLDHLEERIQKPAYLLFVVVVLLFLIIGLVNVIDHDSGRNAVLFGRYSIGYFGVVVAFSLVVVGWASLLLRPNDDRWLTKLLDYVQQRPLLAIGILVGIALVLTVLVMPTTRFHKTALEVPALQVTIFVSLLLAAGLIIFYDWANPSKPQLWRTVVASLLGLLLAVELIIQIFTLFGLVPSLTRTTDTFAPYTRVYQSDEGLGNGIVNQYGLYAPDFKLLPGTRRVALVGDSFIQGFQVGKDENVGVVLGQLVVENAEDEQAVEILPIGYPEYGPGMYLSNWMLDVVDKVFQADEVIIFFDLGSDFQTVDGPGQGVPYFTYVGQGKVALELQDFWGDLHKKEHDVYHGHEGFQLIRLIGSHYLTPRYLQQLVAEPTVSADEPAASTNSDIDLPNGFVFSEATNDEALLIASGIVRVAKQQLDRYGMATKLVTIPVFTEAFYAQDTWNTVFGDSDLLLPERELRQFAKDEGMPFLGLGNYMASLGLTPEDVQKFYFKDGRGRFTPAGHAFAAEAVYQCFFTQTLTAEAGCDRR